jgi:hypothetical protein
MNTGQAKEITVIHENLAHGVHSNAYVEYDGEKERERNTWWYFCLACFNCG